MVGFSRRLLVRRGHVAITAVLAAAAGCGGRTLGEPADTGCASGAALAISAAGPTCALTAAGGVKCWGHNYDGVLGDDSTVDSRVPVEVLGLASGVIAVSTGGDHICAVTAAGAVKCWGGNAYGQLGDGATVSSGAPVDVVGLSSDVIAGSATCAVTADGAVKCWGKNNSGQLGDGSKVDRDVPVDVVGLSSGVVAVSSGGNDTCALTAAGTIKCWGWTMGSYTPIDVVGLSSGVTAVSVGGGFACAVTSAGTVKCWGVNDYGQLGDGSTEGSGAPVGPVDVIGLPSGVIAVSAGGRHACAVTSAGAVMCWGNNVHGQLGDGLTVDSHVPVDVAGLPSCIAAVSAGDNTTCAVTAAGAVMCWGSNASGNLGDGTTTDSHVPVDVVGL